MKITSSICRRLLFTGVLVCLSAYSATAQTANTTSQVTPTSTPATPAKAIGPAAANTPQHQILTSALSPETRDTLQKAMNSTPAK